MFDRLKRLIPERHPMRLGWHYAKAFVAALLYGFPAKKLTVIGITGTDGKTTTVGMAAHILNYSGKKCGALSTAFLQIGEEITWNETQKTSPSPFIIQKFLRDCASAGCSHVVLECSSHGLVQGRLHHLWPTVAAITNTSMEHLDYHGTMEQYIMDKGILFRSLNGNGTKVLNRDDDSFQVFDGNPSTSTITYSVEISEADLRITDLHGSPTGVQATLHHEEAVADISLNLVGSFNIENALCAIGCAKAIGINIQKSTEALRTFTGAPGRMELIDEGQSFAVYVDFTVTPAAYQKTLTTLRQIVDPGKKILVLTGSCGDRMKEKRPIVGKLCSELADIVVVSNEDPYTEDPQTIIDEVWAGVDQSQCNSKQIFDRREGIEYLFSLAESGDAVILCAKGSDTTMWVKDGQIPWNEREIARSLLRNL